MLHASATVLALQGLLDFNPASHGVWLVAAVFGGVILVIVAVDVVDRLRELIVNRRLRSEMDAAGPDDSHERPGTDGFHVHPPDSELRHRHYSEPPKVGRDRRPNELEQRID